MNTARSKKIQKLVIDQIREFGSIELVLPDGIKVEVGITQEDSNGKKKVDDYCYVVASKGGRSTMLDSYNLGLQFESANDALIYEEEFRDKNGQEVHVLDVI